MMKDTEVEMKDTRRESLNSRRGSRTLPSTPLPCAEHLRRVSPCRHFLWRPAGAPSSPLRGRPLDRRASTLFCSGRALSLSYAGSVPYLLRARHALVSSPLRGRLRDRRAGQQHGGLACVERAPTCSQRRPMRHARACMHERRCKHRTKAERRWGGGYCQH